MWYNIVLYKEITVKSGKNLKKTKNFLQFISKYIEKPKNYHKLSRAKDGFLKPKQKFKAKKIRGFAQKNVV